MAISRPHFNLLKELARRGDIRKGGSLLEIGEAAFYGDREPHRLLAELNGELEGAVKSENQLAAIGRAISNHFFAPKSIKTLDFGGGDYAIKHDLNLPIDLDDRFETVINHGTAEHIFNIANVFRLMHEHCAIGGLMIHESPWTGWIDHGFYALQPTVFYDVAFANNYRVELVAAEDLQAGEHFIFESRIEAIHFGKAHSDLNLHLFVALRKMFVGEFKFPMQGIYSPYGPQDVKAEWMDRSNSLRR